MTNSAIERALSERIRGGERPSQVVRDLVFRSELDSQRSAGPHLAAAFPECDGWLMIDSCWGWRSGKNSDAWDRLFDFGLIADMLKCGVPLRWSRADCERELAAIQSQIESDIAEEQAAAREAVSFESLRQKIEQLDGTPLCIQATWDGDTRGWFVALTVFYRWGAVLAQQSLGFIRFGGDIRLFNGEVPPWPEATHAREVGQALASHFSAEFYFPHDDAPVLESQPWPEARGVR